MGKIVRLTESDLVKLVKKVLKESAQEYNNTTKSFTFFYDAAKQSPIGEFNIGTPKPSTDRIIVPITPTMQYRGVGGTNSIHYKCDGTLRIAGKLSYSQNPPVYNDTLLKKLDTSIYCKTGKFINPNTNTFNQSSNTGDEGLV
jgi:hypothetical protein